MAVLTEKQATVLLALGSRGPLSTIEVREVASRAPANDDAFPELDRDLNLEQIVAVGRQLVRKGLVVESGIKYGPKTWRTTELGRLRCAQIRGGQA